MWVCTAAAIRSHFTIRHKNESSHLLLFYLFSKNCAQCLFIVRLSASRLVGWLVGWQYAKCRLNGKMATIKRMRREKILLLKCQYHIANVWRVSVFSCLLFFFRLVLNFMNWHNNGLVRCFLVGYQFWTWKNGKQNKNQIVWHVWTDKKRRISFARKWMLQFPFPFLRSRWNSMICLFVCPLCVCVCLTLCTLCVLPYLDAIFNGIAHSQWQTMEYTISKSKREIAIFPQ